MTSVTEEMIEAAPGRLTDERLAEILAATEGVTPGPWDRVQGDIGDYVFSETRGWIAQVSTDPNSRHIANCDPQTIASIASELLALREAINRADTTPYDPHGAEVSALHHWFADHYSPAEWMDDGCRSENARNLLNTLAKAGLIVVPVSALVSEPSNG